MNRFWFAVIGAMLLVSACSSGTDSDTKTETDTGRFGDGGFEASELDSYLRNDTLERDGEGDAQNSQVAWWLMPYADDLSFLAIWGDGPDNVWLLADKNGQKQLVSWNGKQLEPRGQAISHPASLLSGGGKDSIWISAGDKVNPLRLYDGIGWITPAANIMLMGGVNDLWVSPGGEHVWTSGQEELGHLAGTSFETVVLESPKFQFGQTFLAVHGSSATDVWAAGLERIYRFDGEKWYGMHSAATGPGGPLPGGARRLHVAGEGDVWAISNDPLGTIMHYSGGTWTYKLLPDFSPENSELWATQSVVVVVEPGDIAQEIPNRVHVLREGDHIGFVTSEAGVLTDVWASGPEDLWFCGSGGQLLRYAPGHKVPDRQSASVNNM